MIETQNSNLTFLSKTNSSTLYKNEDNQVLEARIISSKTDFTALKLSKLRSLRDSRAQKLVEIEVNSKGEDYLLYEHIEGQNLTSLVNKKQSIEPIIAAMIIVEACFPIEEAHLNGLTHGDLSPSNLIISEQSKIIVQNFRLDNNIELSDINYKSISQITENNEDEKSDLIGLGLSLYYLASSVTPFDASSMSEILELKNAGVIDLSIIDQNLAVIVEKAINQTVENSYKSVFQLRNALIEYIYTVDGNADFNTYLKSLI